MDQPGQSGLGSLPSMDQCGECGFTYDETRAELAGPQIVMSGEEFAALLRRTDVDLASRQDPDSWSPLEYGCHVRDVLLAQRERIFQARRTHRPSVEPMGREERVDHDGYAEQDPGDVARQLTDAAGMFAHALGRLAAADWKRTVIYNYPQRSERALRWVAIHTVHEMRHHLLDARRQLGWENNSLRK